MALCLALTHYHFACKAQTEAYGAAMLVRIVGNAVRSVSRETISISQVLSGWFRAA